MTKRLAAIVLGAAAGGGFPQWNCRCAVCRLAWAGDGRVKPRTQASLAVSADREHWILLNASPDLRAQIQATPALQPRAAPRGSPIAAVVLTGAEVDQIAGLLTLREGQSFTLYATAETLAALDANPVFGVLAAGAVARKIVAPGEPFALPGGLECCVSICLTLVLIIGACVPPSRICIARWIVQGISVPVPCLGVLRIYALPGRIDAQESCFGGCIVPRPEVVQVHCGFGVTFLAGEFVVEGGVPIFQAEGIEVAIELR